MRFVNWLVPEKVWKLVGYKLQTVVYGAFMYEHVNQFWNNVKDWVNQNTNNGIHLSKSEMIFGKLG